MLYFNGTQTSGRFNGVYVKEDATKVYVEIVDGNYKLYFLNGETKNYVVMADSSTGGSFTTDAASATVFEWNAEKNTLAVAEDSNNRGFGVSATSTYDNFSCYDLSGSYNWGQFVEVEGSAPEQPETPKHEHVACPECGKCTAEDCDGAAEEKCAGHQQAGEPKEAVTVTFTAKDAAAANGWGSAGNNLKNPYAIDENVSISVAGGSNSGKFYTDHLRIYATDTPAGSITLTAKEGYKITSVSFEVVTGTYAFIQYNGVTVENGQVVEVGAASATFNTVKNGSDGKQVRLLSVTVTYEAE